MRNSADYTTYTAPLTTGSADTFPAGSRTGGGVTYAEPGAVRRMFDWASASSGTTRYPSGTAAPASGSGSFLDPNTAMEGALRLHGTSKVPATPENQDRLAQMFPQGDKYVRPASTTAVSGYAPSGGQQAHLYPTSQTSTTTQTWTPSGPRPELAMGDPYQAPEYDEQRVRSIASRIAAPALMRQRRDMMTAVAQSGRYFGNPIARAEATRRALRAYGLGSAETLSRAETAGRAQYQQEYNTSVNEALTNFNATQQRNLSNFQSAMQEFLRSGSNVSKTKTKTQYARSGPNRNSLTNLNPMDANQDPNRRTTAARTTPLGGQLSYAPGR